MRKWYGGLPLLLLAGMASAQSGFEGEDHTYASLLLGSSADVKFAARSMAHLGPDSRPLMDLAAEVLWLACTGDRHVTVDAQSWLAVLIGKSDDPRYEDVLYDCRDESRDPKVVREATAALRRLPRGKGRPYEGGSLKLDAIEAQLDASVARDAKVRKPARFASVAYGQSMRQVYQQLGLPDAVHGPVKRPAARAPIMPLSFKGIIATYDKLGVVLFSLRGGENGQWSVESKVSTVAEGGVNPRVVQVQQYLDSADPNVLKGVAKDLIERGERDRAVLDVVAVRIDRGSATRDKRMADALAWLCEALAKSGDGRYKDFLEDTGETAELDALSSHAYDAAAELPETDEEPFRIQPGKKKGS